MTTESGDLDLIGEVARLGGYEAQSRAILKRELYEYRIWVLTLAGLIRSKQAAGRLKELRLLPELKALQALCAES